MNFPAKTKEHTMTETTEQFVASMDRTTAIFAHHLKRLWSTRHDSASARSSVRDNLRGQRHQRDRRAAALAAAARA